MILLQAVRPGRWLGALLGLSALLLYGFTLSAGPYPGESAQSIVRYLGLDGVTTTAHPLWSVLAWIAAHLPVSDLASRLNVLSMLCGAAAVWMCYRVTATCVFSQIESTPSTRVRAVQAARVAGVLAALSLAISLPFWIVSNRAHPASFDVLLLLAVVHVLFRYRNEQALWLLLLFAAMLGAGTAEFATLVLFTPLFAMALVYWLWTRNEFSVGRVLAASGAYVLGGLVYGFAAWHFSVSQTYVLRGFSSVFQVLWFAWRDQYLLLTGSLPRVGGLLLLLVTVVPWATALAVGRRAFNGDREWSSYLLHGVMTGIVVAVLLNTRISPWALSGFRRLLVTPYLLTAYTCGYLGAYWYLLPEGAPTRLVQGAWRRWTGYGLCAALGFCVLVAAVRNAPVANGRAARAVQVWTDQLLDSMGSREWLVTDGSLDRNLLIAAQGRRQPLRLLDLSQASQPVYLKQVAAQFDDTRLQSLATIGLLPLIREWMTTDPDIGRKVAILDAPDLWLSAGFIPVPRAGFYSGVRDRAEIDPVALWAEHERYWSAVEAPLKLMRDGSHHLSALAGGVLQHVSRQANNLGVLMEDLGRDADAVRAYGKARELDPGNVSSLLNLRGMLERGVAIPDAAGIRRESTSLAQQSRGNLRLWALARFYGYVRAPEMFVQLGWTWALSGNPTLAVTGFKRSVELAGGTAPAVTAAMALLYLNRDDSERSEVALKELLAANPSNTTALVGMARVSTRRADFRTAAEYLERAHRAGLPDNPWAIERATVHLASGDIARSRVVLEELVGRAPDYQLGWAMLAGVMLQQKDLAGIDRCLAELARFKTPEFASAVVRAQIAAARQETEEVRRQLEMALVLRPGSVEVLEGLVRMDMQAGQADTAETHVRKLLSIDSGNPLANTVLGYQQFRRREYALAESSFRKALERERSADILNSLAWIVQERGALDEALVLVQEALKADRESASAWDTLGVIRMKQGAPKEAGEALKRAVGLSPMRLSIQVHLAESYVRQGEATAARELIETLLAKGGELQREEREALYALRAGLKRY